MDLGWVDHADEEVPVGQKPRQGSAIDTGTLHTEMSVQGVVFAQPIQKLEMAGRGIGKDFAAIPVFCVQEGDVEFGLGYIDANNGNRLGHDAVLHAE